MLTVTASMEKLTAMSKDPELLRGILFRCCMSNILQLSNPLDVLQNLWSGP